MEQADTGQRGLDLSGPQDGREREVGHALLQALEQYQQGTERRRGADSTARG